MVGPLARNRMKNTQRTALQRCPLGFMAFCGCSPGVRRCHGDPRLCCKTPLGLRCLSVSNKRPTGGKPTLGRCSRLSIPSVRTPRAASTMENALRWNDVPKKLWVMMSPADLPGRTSRLAATCVHANRQSRPAVALVRRSTFAFGEKPFRQKGPTLTIIRDDTPFRPS
jgi:hypothetical protein